MSSRANYDWDAIVAKVQDPARKPREAAQPAAPEGRVATLDELVEAGLERRRLALVAAMAAARSRGAGEASIAGAIDRAIDSGSDLAAEVGLIGLQS